MLQIQHLLNDSHFRILVCAKDFFPMHSDKRKQLKEASAPCFGLGANKISLLPQALPPQQQSKFRVEY
jgi:hypothetical protein